MTRLLKVACIQAQDTTSTEKEIIMEDTPSEGGNTSSLHKLNRRMGASVELLKAYFCTADDAKFLLLHNVECINCLFDLFWYKDLRSLMLGYILNLMKVIF